MQAKARNPALDGAYARVSRAKNHLSRLKREVTAFRRSFNTAQAYMDPRSGGTVSIEIHEKFLPKMIGILIGEVTYNLRAQDITRMIDNPIYAGIVVWGRHVKSKHLKGYQPVERHVPELQIVTFERFNRAQELAKQRSWMPPKSIGSPFLFSGLLKCRHCGAATVGQRHNKDRRGTRIEWHFYQCRRHHQHGEVACTGECVSEEVARSAIESFMGGVLAKINLQGYLEDAAREMAGDDDRANKLKGDIEEADMGLKRLADAVAVGALDLEAARQKTLELRERKERASKRLSTGQSGNALGAELKAAMKLVSQDLPGLLKEMEAERFRDLTRLVLRRFSVKVSGKWNKRRGQVESYEFTPEFKDFWLTHSTKVVELRGLEPLTPCLQSRCSPN